VGSRSRSRTSATTNNSSLTVGENSGILGDGNEYSSFVDESYTDNSDRSFTDNSDRSITDFSDRSVNDNSVINYLDGGAMVTAENIALGAFDLGHAALEANAFVVDRGFETVGDTADSAIHAMGDTAATAIQSAELQHMENTKFLGGVAESLGDTYSQMRQSDVEMFTDMHEGNTQLFAALTTQSNETNREALQTVERAADAALSVASNVSRSDDTMQTEAVSKYMALGMAAIGAAMVFSR